MRPQRWLAVGIATAVITLSACSDGNDAPPAAETPADIAGDTPEDQPAANEPDVAGLPKVVAEVNGEQIGRKQFVAAYRSQFEHAAAQAEMAGQDLSQDELKMLVLENLIDGVLVVQAAEQRGFDATRQDVDDALAEIAESSQMSPEDYLAAVEQQQGMAAGEVRQHLRTQVFLDQLIAAAGGDFEPTEEELQTAYDEAAQAQEQAGGELPAFEEVRDELVDHVRAEKERATAQQLLERLADEAEITIHLEVGADQ